MAPLAPGEVLAALGPARITVADADAAFWTLPADVAERWLAEPGRIGDEMTDMLLRRAIALDLAAPGEPELDERARIYARAADERVVELWLREQLEALALEVDGAALRAHYEAHPERFRAPERLTVRHLFVSATYRSEARARGELVALRQAIEAGEDSFEAAFARFAEDATAAVRSADTIRGFTLGDERIDPAFLAAASELRRAGELSRVVQSSFGFHLIELVAREPSSLLPFDQVAGEARKAVLRERLTTARRALLASLDPAAVEEPHRAAPAIRAKGFADHPRVQASAAQAGEAAVVSAYRQTIETAARIDAERLARERFLADRAQWERPAQVTYRAAVLDRATLGAERVDELAAAFAAPTEAGGGDLREFLYERLAGEGYRPELGKRALRDLAPELREALQARELGALPARLVVAREQHTVLFEVVGWEEGRRQAFEEVKDQVRAEVAASLAKQRWRLVIATYHQRPLEAEAERIALLRQRFAEGLDPLPVARSAP